MNSHNTKIPRPVLLLGLVSFFNDIASEMIYPIVPLFLTSVLGVPITIVGFIEGIAEATASLTKFLFGYLSDLMRKRKIFVVTGYLGGTVSKLLMSLAFSWYVVLFARFIDRLGKGVRTGARDAMLLAQTTKENKGFIFGFHRAFDSGGAVIGPVLGLILLALFRENMRLIFFLAFIPSLFAVLLLVFFVKEKSAHPKIPIGQTRKLRFSPSLKLFFLVSILFALGNSSDAFLILRARDLGLATTLTVGTYALYHLSQALFATPAGSLADKIGARRVFAYGLLIFSFVYFLFGFVHDPFWFFLIFPLYGIYISFTDGVSKAYIGQFIKESESGTYFGLYQTGVSTASFFASFIGGLLWHQIAPWATFYYGSILSLLAFLVLLYGKFARKL